MRSDEVGSRGKDDVDGYKNRLRKQNKNKNNKMKKSIRRGGKNKNMRQELNIMYSNVQGFSGKKKSLTEIFCKDEPDICLFAETMTKRTKVEGSKSINPVKSIGQNVAILLRRKLKNIKVVKIYEPSDTVNMIGIRFELKNNGVRLYTAHLKQLSVNSRATITDQFDEIRSQFRDANKSREGMLLVLDANVHVGSSGIRGYHDKQDWGGKALLELIKEEDLELVNNSEVCRGVVTRVDPRNGTKSTIDLAICNKFMLDKIKEMEIDEEGLIKPTKYTKTKVTTTDHNTIMIKLIVEKLPLQKQSMLLNTKHKEGRELFIQNVGAADNFFQRSMVDVDDEYNRFQVWWDSCLESSFPRVSTNKRLKMGICDEVKELMEKERWIKKNVTSNPDRGRMISEIRQEIATKISANRKIELESMLSKVICSRNPHAEVFKVRRNMLKSENLGFPLKDAKGNLQVTKRGIDIVINDHFSRVFGQIGVPEGEIWQRYWACVDDVYSLISDLSSRDTGKVIPKKEDIFRIIMSLNAKKAVNGSMTIDLVKLGGEKVWDLIFRCIKCFVEAENIPIKMRIEKMVLLYKFAGEIHVLDNYRGIFLRNIILSVYQKWLYSQYAPTVDSNGTENAFGGRSKRSVQEALLILRLIQDHSKWTGSDIFIKFMDWRSSSIR